ncbi:response regulator [Leptospira sp. 96542]|nr:response regulator [Leptospira sp. 96542]
MSQKKVLIIDDSTVTRLMIKKIILQTNPNCEIEEADTADKVQELFPIQPNFDLITLDQNMPGNLSGLDLVENWKTKQQDLSIVLITANIQDTIKNRAKSLGIDLVEKPISLEKLSPYIQQYL